jgi:hypothetical protein
MTDHVDLISYFLNSFKRRCVPIVPAKSPLLMSLVLSSPPYEPNQPHTYRVSSGCISTIVVVVTYRIDVNTI